LLKVSPLVARLISVPDDLSLEELHDVLQLVFGWSEQAFYNFRIHGQEIVRRRHLRTHLLREFQLRRREKFLYTYDFLDLWEWEIRVLDIEPGSAEAWRPRCLAGRAAMPPEACGGPRGYMRILDQHKYYPPMAEQELVEKALQRMAGVLPAQSHRDLLKELLEQGRGPYDSSKNTLNFNRIVSACRRPMIGSQGSAHTGGQADEVPDPSRARGRRRCHADHRAAAAGENFKGRTAEDR
jgi:Plasmid pRiA4b ORF-3-like protein